MFPKPPASSASGFFIAHPAKGAHDGKRLPRSASGSRRDANPDRVARPNASRSALSVRRRHARRAASMPRNATKSSRTFAQSGLCGTKNRPFDEMTKTPRSLAGTHVGCAPQQPFPIGADARISMCAANKTAGKKMFFFARADRRVRRARVEERGARAQRWFVRCVVEARCGIFFRMGC